MKKKQKFEKKEGFNKLSPRFERMYGLYIAGHLSFNKLKKEFQTVDDVMFYHRMEPDPSSLDLHLRTVITKNFDDFILHFLGLNDIISCRKDIMKWAVTELLLFYVEMEKRELIVKICKELEVLLKSQDGSKEIPSDEKIINDSIQGAYSSFLRELVTATSVAQDPLDLTKFFVHKLIAIYAGLAVSDQEGVKKCRELGPFVSAYWGKEIPMNTTLSYLKHFHEKGNMNEMKLLERFSF